ncbi:MAG: response regulator [Candidatus Hydrogenedentota bacterium]|nr:MAG: response regulator [Candidatus Hydrogenedentota bacterium]
MSKKVVLVVDDQANVRNILEFNFKRRGFDVLAAPDGLAAITMAVNQTPDLVVLDIMMPGIDGFQVLEKLKSSEKTREIPVLVVSAKGTEPDILKAMQLGAKDYVVKPFNMDALIQKAFRLIESAPERKEEKPRTNEKKTLPYPIAGFLHVKANIDSETERDLEETVLALASVVNSGIVVALDPEEDIPSLTFGKLARIQQQVKRTGSELILATNSDSHRQTLSDSGFGKHFKILPIPDDLWEKEKGEKQ